MATNPDDIAQAVNILRALESNRKVQQGKAVESNKPLNKYVLSPLGKVLDVLDTDLNVVTNALKPVLTTMNPSLKSVYDKKGFNIVPSDLIDASIPGKGAHKLALGFAADVMLSPTTYITGIGGFTKAGKLAAKAKSLKDAGAAIKEGSKIAKDISKIYGPGIKGAGEAAKGLAPSLAEQARLGQRSLIHIGIPFSGVDVPLLRGQAIYARLDDTAKALKESNLGKAFNKLFSTSTGNPKFDNLRQEYVALGRMYEQISEENAVEFGKRVDKLSKQLNVPKPELVKNLAALVENPSYGSVTFKAFKAANSRSITNWKLHADKTVEKMINNLPGFDSMSIQEKARTHRKIARELLTQQGGINVYTTGLRNLPEEYVTKFADVLNAQGNLKILKAVGARVQYKYSKISDIIEANRNGINSKAFGNLKGDDALVYALVGKDEYKRVKDFQNKIDSLRKIRVKDTSTAHALINAALKQGTGTEFKSYVNTSRELMSHIDNVFTLNHALYRVNPSYLKKMNPDMYKLLDEVYNVKDWKINALTETFKIPKQIAAKYPGLWEISQDIRKWNQLQLQRELNSGLETRELIGDINYLAHIPTKEIRQYLQDKRGFTNAARVWSPEHANMLQREFSVVDPTLLNLAYSNRLLTRKQYRQIRKHGKGAVEGLLQRKDISSETASKFLHYLTVDEVNTLSKNGKLSVVQNTPFERFFEDNPVNILRLRGKRGEKAIIASEFFQAIKENGLGLQIPKGAYPPPGYKTVAVESLKGLAFEDDVARHLDSYYAAIKLPPGAHPLLDLYDRVQDTWKAWTLAIFPMYHSRNLVGNLWNNYLAGMSNPIRDSKWYADATRIQLAGEKAASKVKLVTQAGEQLDGKQIFEEARRTGILDVGQFWGDIEKYFEDEAKDLLATFNKNTRAPITFGLKTGRMIQNNANLAHFMWRRSQGFSAIDAAKSVKKYQFDYTDLTDAERLIFRRALPFYTWTRKNIPLQIEALMFQPAKASGVLKVKNAMESDVDGEPDERLLPDWMVKSFPIRSRYNQVTKNYEYFLLGGWLPLSDIDKLFEPGKAAANMLSPFIKEPFEQLANKDFFTGREIDLGDEYERVAGMNLPKRPAHVLKKIRLLSEIDKFSDEDATLDTKLTRLFLGRVYPLNEEKERVRLEIELRKKEINYKNQLRRAENKNDIKEIKRVSKLLEELDILQSEL